MQKKNSAKELRCVYLRIDAQITCAASPSGLTIPALADLENFCLGSGHKDCPSFKTKDKSSEGASGR